MRSTSWAVLVVAGLFAVPMANAGVNAREQRQRVRIREGVQSGELTRPEALRLRRQQAALRAEERLYRSTGQGLSPWERLDLQRDMNRTSRQIRLQKSDDQRR